MDYNTLTTLVCILIAVIALRVCISLFFIYRLEEKNARKQFLIDLLVSVNRKLMTELEQRDSIVTSNNNGTA